MASFCAIVYGHYKRWTGARNSAELVTNTCLRGVLAAISIPIFSTQPEKAREATDEANLRAAYAAGVAQVLDNEPSTDSIWIYTTDGKLVDSKSDTAKPITGKASQTSFQAPTLA
jgi:hypothetical protein